MATDDVEGDDDVLVLLVLALLDLLDVVLLVLALLDLLDVVDAVLALREGFLESHRRPTRRPKGRNTPFRRVRPPFARSLLFQDAVPQESTKAIVYECP